MGLSEGPLTLRCDSRGRSHLFLLSSFKPHPQHHVSEPCLSTFTRGLAKSQGREPLTLS